MNRPAFDVERYRRERLVTAERRARFLEDERERVERILGLCLVVAAAGTKTTPLALLDVLENLVALEERQNEVFRRHRKVGGCVVKASKRPALFSGFITENGKRRRARRDELREAWRLWAKHRDIREGRVTSENAKDAA